MLVFIETRSLEELDACHPLSAEERRYRLEMLGKIRRELAQRGRMRVQLGEDPTSTLTFELELRPDRNDPERTLEKIEYLLGVAGFAYPEPLQGWITIEEEEELIIECPTDLASY